MPNREKYLGSRRVRLRIDEPFGGLAEDVREIDILTGQGGGDCGFPFKPGESYLVYSHVEKDKLLHTGVCSHTRRIQGPDISLRMLRDQKQGFGKPSLAGRLVRRDRNFLGLLGQTDPQPLPGTLVRVTRKDGGSYETRSDADGFYSFPKLPAGRYDFSADLPPGLALAFYIGTEAPPRTVALSPAGCEEHDLSAFSTGTIEGRVLDASNTPLPHAFVYLIPAAATPTENTYWEYQNLEKRGFFRFIHVPPGEYRILVNPENKPDPAFPYLRMAQTVRIGAGDQIREADFHLGRPFSTRRLTVQIQWADGRPLRDFTSIYATGSHSVKGDTLTLLANDSSEVSAQLICRYADAKSEGPGATFRSNAIAVRPGDGQTELVLTMPVAACPDVPGKTVVN